LTDETGAVVYRFAYSEITGITDEDSESLITLTEGSTNAQCFSQAVEQTGISFLYNGQYGVTTDADGLYYMRARYYNPDIKRFINRDILEGSPANTQSLNRYSYVQGNPVSQTDPFGLSPEGGDNGDSSGLGHTILDVLGIFWDGADVINAVWYAMEGNYMMAAVSAASALPILGCGIASAAKLTMKNAARASKVADCVVSVSKLMSHTVAGTVAAIDTYYAVQDYKSAKEAGTLTFADRANVVLCAVGTVLSGGFAVRNAKKSVEALSGLRGKSVANAMAGVSTASSKLHNDGRSNNLTGHGNGTDIGTYAEEATVSNRGKDLAKAETVCGVGDINCFIAGTLVKTADGDKKIENIEAGDEVWAYDAETGECGIKKVVQIFRNECTELAHVTIDGETIDSSAGHPYYVVGRGFVHAQDLKTGDKVLLLDGSITEIERVELEHTKEPVKIYNFEVEDWHTYYVSESGVLVHNRGCNSTKLGKNMMREMGLASETKWSGYQAQHIIPVEMENHPVIQKIGMDINDASNGLFLRIPGNSISAMSRHRGYHSVYNNFVRIKLDSMNINQSADSLRKQVNSLQQDLKYLQRNGLPLYSSQGAHIDLWQRSIERIR